MREDFALDADLRSFSPLEAREHILLHHEDVKAVNTEADPNQVAPVSVPLAQPDGGRISVRIPPLSWNVLRFARKA